MGLVEENSIGPWVGGAEPLPGQAGVPYPEWAGRSPEFGGWVMEMFRQIGRIVRDGPATHLSGAINSSLTEKVIARTYAAAAFTFGALSVGPAFSGQRVMGQVWAWVFGLLLSGDLPGARRRE